MLGTTKEAGLARPLLRIAGEKQGQVFFNFEVQSVMLERKTVRGLEVRSHVLTEKIGGRHCSCCRVRGPEVQSPMLVEEIVLGTEVRNLMLVKRSDPPFQG